MSANNYPIDTTKHQPIVINNATETDAGVMSAADKVKLDGLIPGGGATNVIIPGATGALATGSLAYISAANTFAKTDSAALNSSRVVGVYEGTPGQIFNQGAVLVNMTTAGGSPANGAPVYIAAATDDGGTGAGKATATPPADGSGLFLTPVGTVLDNSGYAGAKTCVVAYSPDTPIGPLS